MRPSDIAWGSRRTPGTCEDSLRAPGDRGSPCVMRSQPWGVPHTSREGGEEGASSTGRHKASGIAARLPRGESAARRHSASTATHSHATTKLLRAPTGTRLSFSRGAASSSKLGKAWRGALHESGRLLPPLAEVANGWVSQPWGSDQTGPQWRPAWGLSSSSSSRRRRQVYAYAGLRAASLPLWVCVILTAHPLTSVTVTERTIDAESAVITALRSTRCSKASATVSCG